MIWQIMSPFLGICICILKHLNTIEPRGMKWAWLREMIVDLFITISLCIKCLNLPGEIFLDSFCSTRMK